MTRSLTVRPGATKGNLLVEFTEGKTSLNLPPDFKVVEQHIRALLQRHLPHGSKQELARITRQHANHISSQFSGESGLREVTVAAALWILMQRPELHAVVAAIRELRDGNEAIELHEQMGLLISFGTKQLFLPGLK